MLIVPNLPWPRPLVGIAWGVFLAPVPPIYQPEVMADAVTWVADHYRRQLFIGLSTVIVIQGDKLAPWFGD
jgi:hypothetical protein